MLQVYLKSPREARLSDRVVVDPFSQEQEQESRGSRGSSGRGSSWIGYIWNCTTKHWVWPAALQGLECWQEVWSLQEKQ